MMNGSHGRARGALGLMVLTLALVAGCSRGGGPEQVTAPPPPPPLVADTPLHAVEVIREAWAALDTAAYHRTLTADFHAVFNILTGELSATTVSDWHLEDELICAQRLFGPPTRSITLTLASPAGDQAWPGRDPVTHRLVVADYALDVQRAPSPSARGVGYALFYLVRGDSAQLSPGDALTSDSTRWYLASWVDPTPLVAVPGPPPAPAHASAIALTWGRVKGWAMGMGYMDWGFGP